MYSEKQIEETFNSIIEDIEAGYALRNVLKGSDKPSSQTFYNWLEDDKEKSKRYTHACEVRAGVIFEDILDIADDQESDVYEDADGNEQVNHNVINRARLRIDSRKWMLGKMNPSKYSDKIQVDTTEFKEQPLFPDVPKNDSNK